MKFKKYEETTQNVQAVIQKQKRLLAQQSTQLQFYNEQLIGIKLDKKQINDLTNCIEQCRHDLSSQKLILIKNKDFVFNLLEIASQTIQNTIFQFRYQPVQQIDNSEKESIKYLKQQLLNASISITEFQQQNEIQLEKLFTKQNEYKQLITNQQNQINQLHAQNEKLELEIKELIGKNEQQKIEYRNDLKQQEHIFEQEKLNIETQNNIDKAKIQEQVKVQKELHKLELEAVHKEHIENIEQLKQEFKQKQQSLELELKKNSKEKDELQQLYDEALQILQTVVE